MNPSTHQPAAASQPSRGQFARRLAWGLMGLGAFLAVGMPMLSMMVFMGRMTDSMARMVVSVEAMRGDVSVMSEQLVEMAHDMNAITIGVASMDDINRGTNTFTQPWTMMRNVAPW
jgi:hypothetical protein